MNFGYEYYRDNFIRILILSVGCIGIFWDYFAGRSHPDTEPGVLILLALIMCVGNVWFFIAMRRAKRKKQSSIEQATILDETHAITNINQQPTLEEVTRKRKVMRRLMSFWCIGGGLLFTFFDREWIVYGLPAHWVGYVLILMGVLGLAGVNVFYGGPLDLRLDRPNLPHQPTERK